MLRDVICALPGVATWPCDEINYIWRHGNVRHPSDELTPVMARPSVVKYIRRKFNWVASRYDAHTIVEKTCANSLRVPFVDAVVPDAKYVFIHRDGLDAVGSAMSRWQAALDLPYLARKAQFVPFSDLPYYGGRYLWNRVYRLVSRERRLAFWGPRLERMDELLANHLLDEVCALQWQACVDKAVEAFSAMANDRWLGLAYEEFVQDPKSQLARVVDFMELSVQKSAIQRAVVQVRPDSVGKGRAVLAEGTVRRLEALVGNTLARWGYG